MFFTNDYAVMSDTYCNELLDYAPEMSREEIKAAEIQKTMGVVTAICSNTNIKNVIVVGHEPIVSHVGSKQKVKKDKKYKAPKAPKAESAKNSLPKSLPVRCLTREGIEFLINIYSSFIATNNYYLCADIHSYQRAAITLQLAADETPVDLTQLVAGTGGADLEKRGAAEPFTYNKFNPNKSMNKLMNTSLEYVPKYQLIESVASHGYLECNFTNVDLTFEFVAVRIPTNNNGLLGGRKKKTQKKKTKEKKTRKHKGIYQRGPKKNKLKPGFKYSGKKTKTGLKIIIKIKQIKQV